MSDLERRSGSRPSRRARERRAYNLVVVGSVARPSCSWSARSSRSSRRSAGRSRSSPRSSPWSARCCSGEPSADGGAVLVAEAVGRALAGHGVDVVFGLLGSGNLTVTNAMRDAGARFYAARHEGGAICMADGYGRVSGRIAACSVHQGPGLTNTITGLTEAAKSRTPLLVLAADTPAAALRSNFRIDQTGLVEAVGAVAERVHGPDTAMADVARAVRRARVERRAVVLMLPLDVQAADCDPTPAPLGPELAPAAPGRAALEAAVETLRAAERPAIIAGRGAVLAGAGPALRRLGELTGAVLATSAVAKGLFAGDPFARRHRRRLLLPGGRPPARRGRRGDRVRRRAEPVDHAPRHAAGPDRPRRPGRPRRGGDRRAPAGRHRRRRRRRRDRRDARRGARRPHLGPPHRRARGRDRGRRVAPRPVRGERAARPAHAHDRARRDAAARAHGRRRLRALHGLAVDVPARPRRRRVRVPAGLPVRRARRSGTRSARRSRGPTG